MDTSVSNLNKRLEDTKQLVTRNQTEALQLSEQYAIPANVITFSKTLLYFFNTNSAAAPTAALLEPFFSQEVNLSNGTPLTDNILEEKAKAHTVKDDSSNCLQDEQPQAPSTCPATYQPPIKWLIYL